jgi:hypothetical protein
VGQRRGNCIERELQRSVGRRLGWGGRAEVLPEYLSLELQKEITQVWENIHTNDNKNTVKQ